MKKNRVFLKIFFFSFLLFFIQCKKKVNSEEIQNRTLHIGNQTEPQELDPHIVTGIPEFHILLALFEGLVIAEPRELKPVGGVAKEWECSPDKKEWTFYLRNNAKWSNGDNVTAEDFRFSYQRILSPALGSEYAYMLYCIENAEEYHKGKISDFSKVGVIVKNDTTLIIRLSKPIPYFLSLLAHHSWFPVHPPTILKSGKIDSRGSGWTKPENFVGNGPFKLSKWEVNKIVTVKKNEHYWDKSSIKIDEINFYPVENQQTEERLFRTGKLHITSGLSPLKIEWYKENQPEALRNDPYLGTYFYVINVKKPPLDNVLVRKALSLAIDRKAIVNKILKGGQLPATSFTPPNTGESYLSPSNFVYFDTIEAKKSLKRAGYDPTTNSFPQIELLYNTSETHHIIAQAIQQMWKQYLNIDVVLVNQEWKVYLASKQEGNFHIARMGWIGDYNDPMTFLDMWVKDGGNNNSGWHSSKYDSLINIASSISDTKKRAEVFYDAEKILLTELPIIPIYFYTNVYLIRPEVKGWYPNILNLHNYKFIYLE